MTSRFDSLSLQQKIGQLFFIGIPGPEVDKETRELLDEVQPGGICLFARNIRSAPQTAELTEGLSVVSEIAPFISIDQEGGTVDRLRRIMEPMPAVNRLRSIDDARRHGGHIADALSLLGINMNFAPVVDITTGSRDSSANGLAGRTFKNGADTASDWAEALLDAMQLGGLIGCLKHFPGLGASQVDSHEDLPVVDITDDELADIDLAPYRAIIAAGKAKVVMSAHAVYSRSRWQRQDELGRPLPASLSAGFVTDLLRQEMKFGGVSVTDDLEMGAILKNYTISEAALMALKAGQDMLAICAGAENIRYAFRAVVSAAEAGEISANRISQSIERIASVKSGMAPRVTFDPDSFAAVSEQVKALSGEINS